MKKINEMTDQEILSLTDEQLETLVKIQMAEEGIKILEKPKEPDYFEIPQPDELAYSVSGFEYLFLTAEAAQAASEFILSNKSGMRNESYGKHYELKFLTTDYYHFNDIGKIQPKKFYSRKLISEIENSFSANEKLKKDYESALSEYTENYNAADWIRDEIYGKSYEVRDKQQKKENMKQVYQDYLRLADGNEEIAMTFLKKAYTIDEETEEFITTSIGAEA